MFGIHYVKNTALCFMLEGIKLVYIIKQSIVHYNGHLKYNMT